MSNAAPKSPRTLQEIQTEYSQLCTKAGDLQYKIRAFTKDLELLNDAIRDLNFEYVSAKQLADKVAEEVAASKAKEAEEAAAKAKAEAPAVDNVTPIKE